MDKTQRISVSIEQDTTPDLIWQSPEKNEGGEPFLKVKRARGYYYYAERGGVDSVAFILMRDGEDGLEFGLINESKPPLDEFFGGKVMMTTAFGGSMDKSKSFDETVLEEVLEESGYEVTEEDIACVGSTLVSTQMNQACVGYCVNVTGKTPGKTEVDYKKEDAIQNKKDPHEFSHNKVVWMTPEEVMKNNDWKSIWIMTKILAAAEFGW